MITPGTVGTDGAGVGSDPAGTVPPTDPRTGSAVMGADATVDRATVGRGAAWLTLQTWANRLISLLLFVVLGRLLQPRDFGLASLAAVFTAMTGLLLDRGLTSALIQRKAVDQKLLSTAFWTAIGSGVGLTVLTAAAAPLLAVLLHEPRLAPLLMLLGCSFLFAAVEIVPYALIQRRFQFKVLAIRTLVAVLVSGVVAVVAAVLGAGAYALVVQSLVFSAVAAGAMLVTCGWRPSFAFERGRLREMRGYSAKVFGINAVSFAVTEGDKFLIGSGLGPIPLGFYSIAQKMQLTLQDVTTTAIGSVAFPAFARLRSEPERLRGALLKMGKAVSLAVLPAFAALFAMSQDLVPAVFGNQWAGAVPIARVLCVVAALSTFTLFDRAVLLAAGRAGTELLLVALSAAGNVAAFFVTFHWGVWAVSVGYAVRAAVFFPVRTAVMSSVAGLRPWAFTAQCVPALIGSAVAAAVVNLLRRAHPGRPGLVGVLLTEGLPMVAAYLLVVLLVDRRGCATAVGLALDTLPVLGRLGVLRRFAASA